MGRAGGLESDHAVFVGVALREAVVNALRHGHNPDGAPTRIGLHLTPDSLVITVRDRGPRLRSRARCPTRAPSPTSSAAAGAASSTCAASPTACRSCSRARAARWCGWRRRRGPSVLAGPRGEPARIERLAARHQVHVDVVAHAVGAVGHEPRCRRRARRRATRARSESLRGVRRNTTRYEPSSPASTSRRISIHSALSGGGVPSQATMNIRPMISGPNRGRVDTPFGPLRRCPGSRADSRPDDGPPTHDRRRRRSEGPAAARARVPAARVRDASPSPRAWPRSRATRIKPDCVVSDILMPDMDGESLLRALRAVPGLESVPFIALSAVRSEARIRTVIGAGADAFLLKPFPLRELTEKVRSLVERPAAARAGRAPLGRTCTRRGRSCARSHTMSTTSLRRSRFALWAAPSAPPAEDGRRPRPARVLAGGAAHRPARGRPGSYRSAAGTGRTPRAAPAGRHAAAGSETAPPRRPSPKKPRRAHGGPGAGRDRWPPAERGRLRHAAAAAGADAGGVQAEGEVRRTELSPETGLGFGRFTRVEGRGRSFVILTEAVEKPKFTVTTIITEKGVPLRKVETALPHPLAREEDERDRAATSSTCSTTRCCGGSTTSCSTARAAAWCGPTRAAASTRACWRGRSPRSPSSPRPRWAPRRRRARST